MLDLLAAERAVLAGMGIEAGDRDPRRARCRTGAAARGSRRAPLATISSTVSRPGTSRSGTWVVTGTTRRVGPASIIATQVAGDAAALGDELGLAGMDEADRVELRLGDRPGDQRRGGARAGQADREFERVEAVARAFEVGPPGHDLAVSLLTRSIGSASSKRAAASRGSSIDRDRAVPDRARPPTTLPTAKKGGSAPARRALPALGDDFRPDPRRVAERDGERDVVAPAQR